MKPAMPAKSPPTVATEPTCSKLHPELPGIIVDWFVTTLIKTPGHAPADTVASAAILNQIWTPEGVARSRSN